MQEKGLDMGEKVVEGGIEGVQDESERKFEKLKRKEKIDGIRLEARVADGTEYQPTHPLPAHHSYNRLE